MSVRPGPVIGCVAALSVVTASSRAGASDEPIRIDYRAVSACPSAERFEAQLAEHATGFRLAAPGERSRRFVLRIVPRAAGYAGHLVIETPDGSVAEGGQIVGDDCADVALGLTVAVAIAIAPHGDTARPPRSPAAQPTFSPPNERVASPSPSSGGSAATGTEAGGTPSSTLPVALRTKPGRPLDVALGADVEVTSALSGSLAGTVIFGEVRLERGASNSRGLVSTLRAGLRQGFRRTIVAPSSRVALQRTAGFVRVCPLVFPFGRFEVGPCLEADVGVLVAEAVDLPFAQKESRLWIDWGGVLPARWFVDRTTYVEASIAVQSPLTQHRLRIDPDGVVFQPNRAFVTGALGVGFVF